MDIITRLINTFLNILSAIFFIAVIIVFGGMLKDYASAANNKLWMNSPSTYNVHWVEVRDQNRFNTTSCWYIEGDNKSFHQSRDNSNSKCDVPYSVLSNWEDYGKNHRSLGIKFWFGYFLFFAIGGIVFAWMPLRVFGATPAGFLSTGVCYLIVGVMTLFMMVQDVRAAYAPPKTWRATVNGRVYDAEVKFFLQDKHGQVYTWSAGGTADSSRVSDLGNPTNQAVK